MQSGKYHKLITMSIKSFFCPGSYGEPEAEYNPASSYNDNKGTWDVRAGAELQGTGYSQLCSVPVHAVPAFHREAVP